MPPADQTSEVTTDPHILRAELLHAYEQAQNSNLITYHATEHMLEFRCNGIDIPSCSFPDYSDIPISIEQTLGLRNLVGNIVHFRCYYDADGQPLRCEFRYDTYPEWHILEIV